MRTNRKTILRFLQRKVVTILLLASSAIGAFATLGDGKGKDKNKTLLSTQRISITPGSFTLKSGYHYRGSEIINQEASRFIFLNTTITYQKGNTTYIVPLKKKVILENVHFKLGVQQLNK
jgi:hypothetical protein